MQIKLLVLTAHYPPADNAASIRISEFVKRFSMDEDICDIKVLVYNPQIKNMTCTNNWIKIYRKVEVLHVRRIFPAIFHKLQEINPFTLLEWSIALLKIKNYRPDIIISSSPPPYPVILAYVCSKLFKSRYLVDIRDDWNAIVNDLLDTQPIFVKYSLKPFSFFVNFIFILSYRSATLISCVHEILKVKFANFQKVPIIVVPNGINNQELLAIKSEFDKETIFRKNNIQFNSSTKFLIYAGHLGAPYYNPEIILDALQKLISNGLDIRYIIIGDGDKKEKIAQLAEKKGIKENIYLLGKKKHSESLELMLASDIAIYSLNKNDAQVKYAFGLKVYEYIACNLPILAVADDDSAVSTVVARNNIGISLNWVEATKNDSLKKALLNIIEDYTLYSQNVAVFYENNLSKFDRDTGLNILHAEVSNIFKK